MNDYKILKNKKPILWQQESTSL